MFIFLSGIFTGLGLFLLGLRFLTEGLYNINSQRLSSFIRTLDIPPVIGIITGIVVTCLLQSSSGVTIIVIGLVEANLINLYQATPIIMGANIGTTFTAQILAFQPNQYIFIPFFLGILLSFVKNKKKIAFLEESLLGFSLIFIGIDLLGKGLSPLESQIRFQEILLEFGNNRLLGIVMGFCLTAIIQSSSTGVAILQSLANNSLINITAATSILLGQNIGTCVTTLLSSIPLGPSGKRAALIHILFNLLGVIIIFPFVDILCSLSLILSPYNPSRQIANVHSLFNIITTIIFLPLIPLLVKISKSIIRN